MITTVKAVDQEDGPDAPAEHATETKNAVSQMVSFRLADELYGIDILAVQEIILMGRITTIPDVPEYVKGLINLRGKVFPVIDLRLRFRLPAAEREVIVLRHFSELSFGEIALIMDTPLGTALARAHRGLKKLRSMLEDLVSD